MKQLIIYDLDGTLVDTRQDIAEAVNYMLRKMEASPLSSADIERYVGEGVPHLIKSCLHGADRERLKQGMGIYRTYYAQHLLDHSVLYPGARELLEHFQHRTQAVITNKPNPYSRAILEGLGVANFFSAIIAGNSGFPRKPDPAALRALMQDHGATPHETVMVGDSPIDIETARRVGVLTVAVTHGFADEAELRAAMPEVIVGHFGDLMRLAQQQNW